MRNSAEKIIKHLENLPDAEKTEFDKDNAFMLYATFCGDVERTAHALRLTPVQVMELAETHKWNEQLRGILELKKSGKPGDVERAVNRAVNFVQAHRLRLLLERTLGYICKLPTEEMYGLMLQRSYDKAGNVTEKLGTRPLADLAAALEKCHVLTYLALNDSTTERRARDEQPDSISGGELHAQIAAAMSQHQAVEQQFTDAQEKKT